MKTFKFFAVVFFAATVVVSAVSCEKETGKPEIQFEDFTLTTVDFEAAELTDGVLKASYTEDGLTFNYADPYAPYWNGFSISNKTDMTTPGQPNQFSAYNANSTKFAIAYVYDVSCNFGEGLEYVIDHAYFTNSTWTYLAVKDGNDGNDPALVKGPFADGDWLLLTVKGHNAAGDEPQTREIYLADYRAGKTFIMTDWTKCDLSSLGAVNKLTFEITSSDSSSFDGGATYSPNTPQYFCLDNLAYRVPRETKQ